MLFSGDFHDAQAKAFSFSDPVIQDATTRMSIRKDKGEIDAEISFLTLILVVSNVVLRKSAPFHFPLKNFLQSFQHFA